MSVEDSNHLDAVDHGAGRIASAGALTGRGADLLQSVAPALQNRGRHQFEVALDRVRTADEPGLRLLQRAQQVLPADPVLLHADAVVGDPAVRAHRGRRWC